MKLSELPKNSREHFDKKLKRVSQKDPLQKKFVEKVVDLDKDIETCLCDWYEQEGNPILEPTDKLMHTLVSGGSDKLKNMTVSYFAGLTKGSSVGCIGSAEAGIVSHPHNLIVIKPAETGSRSLNALLTGILPEGKWKPLDASDFKFAREYRVIMSIRHPFERAVHMYRRLLSGGLPWIPSDRAYRLVQDTFQFDQPTEVNFREFVLANASPTNPVWSTPLFTPFSEYIGPTKDMSGPRTWVRMERIHTDSADLRRILGLPTDSTHPYIGWHGDITNLADFYKDREVARIIAEIYAADMELGGYKQPDYVTINS